MMEVIKKKDNKVIDSVKMNGKTYYNKFGFMEVYSIKSHRSIYMGLEKGTIEKKKFLGRTVYAYI